MSQVSEESSREDVEPMGLVSTTHFVSAFIFTLLLMISEPSEHKPSIKTSFHRRLSAEINQRDIEHFRNEDVKHCCLIHSSFWF